MKPNPARFGVWARILLLLLGGAAASLGQRHPAGGPAPLDPERGAQEARALVAELLALKPERNSTNTGWVRIRDAAGKERQIPARFEVFLTPTHWVSAYETLPAPDSPGGVRLTITRAAQQPNRYELRDPADGGAPPPAARELTAAEIMQPFAGSDFWIADLGLEFLHWPRQQVLKYEMRHGKSCKVLESINPQPVPGGYSRVVAWFMVESPHGLIHADAYDAQGSLLKRFDPRSLEKVDGEYQLAEMEIRNRKTGSQTWIKFNLGRE